MTINECKLLVYTVTSGQEVVNHSMQHSESQ